jgi:hypothetical protein
MLPPVGGTVTRLELSAYTAYRRLTSSPLEIPGPPNAAAVAEPGRKASISNGLTAAESVGGGCAAITNRRCFLS